MPEPITGRVLSDEPVHNERAGTLDECPACLAEQGRTLSAVAVVREALEGEEACVTFGYYGASHRIDAEHAADLAHVVLDALDAAGLLTTPARTPPGS